MAEATTRLSAVIVAVGFVVGLATGWATAPALSTGGSAGPVQIDTAGSGATVDCRHPRAGVCRIVAEKVLPRLGYPWQTLGRPVTVRDRQPEQWVAGAARDGDDPRIELYVGAVDPDPPTPSADVEVDLPVEVLVQVVAHEIGHVLHQRCGDRLLEQWRQARGLPADAALHEDGSPHEYSAVAEDFADAVAQWLTGIPSRTTAGPVPDPAWLDQAAQHLFVPGPVCPSALQR